MLPFCPVGLASLQFRGIQVKHKPCNGPCLTCHVTHWEEGDTFQMKLFILRSNSTKNLVSLLLFRMAETNLSCTADGTQQGLSIKIRQRFPSPKASSWNSAREVKGIGAAWRQGKAFPTIWWTVPATSTAVTPPQPAQHGENTAAASPSSSSLLPVPAFHYKALWAPSTFSLLHPSPWPGSSCYALRLFCSGFRAPGCNLD